MINSRINIKNKPPFISSALNYIHNRCLASGIHLVYLKYTEMKPLFKNVHRNNMSNFRPIAILISFSMVLEEVVYERLCHCINNINIISEEHCGFWRNSSTGRASHKLIYDILQVIYNTLSVGGTFCDNQTAFYFINHDILLRKFQFYCSVGNAKALTTSYLEVRYQLFSTNSTSSLWGRINTAVPQGLIHNFNTYVFIKFVY